MKIGGIFFNLTYIFSTGGSTYLLEEPHTFGRPVHHVNSGPVDGELVDMGDWLECHQDISTGLPRIFEPSTTIFLANVIVTYLRRLVTPNRGEKVREHIPPQMPFETFRFQELHENLCETICQVRIFKGHEVSQFALHPLKSKRLETSHSSNFFNPENHRLQTSMTTLGSSR